MQTYHIRIPINWHPVIRTQIIYAIELALVSANVLKRFKPVVALRALPDTASA